MTMKATIPALFLVPVILQAADVRKFGQPLTLKEEVKVSELFANPDKYAGKRVRVQGLVTDVCAERGCWIKIGADKQEILFKVTDGVITFPMAAKGSPVVAEGMLRKRVVTVEQQKTMCENEAKALGKPTDYGKITGPKTYLQLDGLGAEIK